jgi:hydrogenase nickel incorporation protein HypA/HybF
MHELSIATSILETVQAEAARRPGARFVKVGLRVGELAGIDTEALSFSFDALVKSSELEPLQLEIEFCPRRHRCPKCEEEFVVREYVTACPKCGETRTQFAGGDELDIAYLEIEEPQAPCGAEGE